MINPSRSIFTVLLIFSFSTHRANSQSRLNFHLGESTPVFDYASDNLEDERAGGAGPGMNAGLQFTYQFTQPAIGLFLGFDFVTCTYKKSVQSGIKDMFQDSGLPDADYRFPRYNNLPLSAGISIYSPLHGKVSIHTDCGIVLNSLSISDFIVSAYGQSIEVSTDWTHAIGYRFGMGLIFNDEVTLAADYFGLGSHDISVKTKTPVSTENSEGRQRIEMINITMGLSF